MPVLKVCQCCSKEFSTPNRRSEQVKFCSLKCKTKAGQKTVKCVACKSMFTCKLHEDKKFCSRSCFHEFSKGRKHLVDPDRPRYYKNCEVCGNQFRVTLTRKDTARFCSVKCRSISPELRIEISERMQGEKHWRWAGGERENSRGYIRHKRKVLGTEKVMFNHRAVILAALLESEPNHPFLITVDGVVKLDPNIEVHHIDRNRTNNELSNLLAVTKMAHSNIHHKNLKPKPWECYPRDPLVW